LEPSLVPDSHVESERRRRTEDALAASESLLRQFIKYTPAAVAMLDRELRYIQASDRWLTDYHLAGQDLAGRSHYEVFPEISERWHDVHRRVLAGAVESCEEDPFPRADGSLDWLQWEVRPWFDAGGEVGGVIMFTQVVTERKRIAEKLRESEERLQSAMQHSPIGMALVAPDGRWTDVNAAFSEIVGYTKEELLRIDFQTVSHPDDLAADLENVRRMLAGEIDAYQMEKRYVHKSGRVIWAQLNVSLVLHPDGTPRHFISQVQDISERKRSDAALRAGEARLQRVVASPILGIAFGHPDGRVDEANDEFLRIAGYSRDELMRGFVNLQRLIPDERASRALRDVAPSGTAKPWETEIVRKDGTRVPILIGVSTFDKQRQQDVAFVFDLSERRELEEQLRRAQKMEAVGRLAAGVAHDFNNVLAGIVACSELLRDDLAPGHPGHEEVIDIRKAAERGVSLTRQLLAFSRQQVLEPCVLDLNDLIGNLERMLRRLIGAEIQLVTRFTPELGHVKADPGQLEQVLMNLAVNARDAMPEGGKLTIETANVTLDVPLLVNETALPPGDYVSFSVSDSGIGMDLPTQSRLFEPFFTTKEVGKGTGLGLSTAYGVVRQSGGTIEVESQLQCGATFRVLLPRVQEVLDVKRHTNFPTSIGGKETVLVVDDDAVVRQATRKILVRFGYKVLDASNARDASELAGVYIGTIDVLLTDLVLPDSTGPALAGVLLGERPRLGVLYMSGHSDESAARHGITSANSAYVQKPFSATVLADKLRALLDREPLVISEPPRG
jgi:two-component system cell cycle sensor histidine kinase/response regulator CckA